MGLVRVGVPDRVANLSSSVLSFFFKVNISLMYARVVLSVASSTVNYPVVGFDMAEPRFMSSLLFR